MIGRIRRYLVEEPKREREAIHRLIDLKWVLDEILGPLGLHAGFSWFVLGLSKNRLCSFAEGDVDILAGKLEWGEPKEFEALLASELKEKTGWHPSNVVFLPLWSAPRLAVLSGRHRQTGWWLWRPNVPISAHRRIAFRWNPSSRQRHHLKRFATCELRCRARCVWGLTVWRYSISLQTHLRLALTDRLGWLPLISPIDQCGRFLQL